MGRIASTPRLLPAAVHGAGAATVEEPLVGVRHQTRAGAHVTVAAYALDPGAAVPLHSHREEQVTVVLTGAVDLGVDGEEHQLFPGETFVIAAGTTHNLRAGPDGARFLAVLAPREAAAAAHGVDRDRENQGGKLR